MLENLSEKIRDCYRRAEECERTAKAHTRSDMRQDFLDQAERWIKLARSYELVERIQRFTYKTRH